MFEGTCAHRAYLHPIADVCAPIAITRQQESPSNSATCNLVTIFTTAQTRTLFSCIYYYYPLTRKLKQFIRPTALTTIMRIMNVMDELTIENNMLCLSREDIKSIARRQKSLD